MAKDLEMQARAGRQRNHLCRPDVLEAGGSDSLIRARLSSGRWRRRHAGVYCVAPAPVGWKGELQAAVLAAGPAALVSHRAALVLWGLDGLRWAPVEITVPYEHGPVPSDVVRHRTRRRMTSTFRHGIPVTTVERTLIDCGAVLPPWVVEEAFDSAVRRKLTTHALVARELKISGGRGVRGSRAVRAMLAARENVTATGSAAELAFLRVVRDAGIEAPELQVPVRLPDHTVAVVDFMWPDRRKIVEIDGLDAHGSARSLEADLDRQNQLLSLGYGLRRYSGRTVRRRPEHVAAALLRFLEEP